jgi:subtilisin family serine protease
MNEANVGPPLQARLVDCAHEIRRRYRRHPAVLAVAGLLAQRGARRGVGARLGLIDMGLQADVPDLRSAHIELRRFDDGATAAAALTEHGTHAASLLVAQGHHVLRGLVPGGRLVMAVVGRADGKAGHAQVADALQWLLRRRVHVVALPLGASESDPGLARALRRAQRQCVVVFAAAGNVYPQRVLFPARLHTAVATGAARLGGGLRADGCRRPALDQIAPGSDIQALVGATQLAYRSGSSVACVVATGLAALALGGSGTRGPPDASRNARHFNSLTCSRRPS